MSDYNNGRDGKSVLGASSAVGVHLHTLGASDRAAEMARNTPRRGGGGQGYNSPRLALLLLAGLAGVLFYNFGFSNGVGWGMFGINLVVGGIVHGLS
jgi:hypothetical protein